MAQGYYTLQEASKFLNMSVDDLKAMAQKGQIRSFQDRGTWRFRVQDIQELGRARGISSDGDVVLGDASLAPPKSPASPKSGAKQPPSAAKSPPKKSAPPEVFSFNVEAEDDSVDIGAEILSPKSGTKSKPGKASDKKPKTPTVGSDSDVRLVADGSDVTFTVQKPPAHRPPDSDVKVPSDPFKPRSGAKPKQVPSSARTPSNLAVDSGAKPGSGAKQTTPKPTTPRPPDSGVRLVPMESDSDVKLVGASDEVDFSGSTASASDSNVRLDKVELPPSDSQDSMMLTEEINLDEEIQKQQEKDKDKPATKLKPKSELKLPTSSPFELSDSDLEMPSELRDAGGPKTPRRSEAIESDSSDFDLAARESTPADSSDFDLKTEQERDGSSDFDLVPGGKGSESDDFSLEASDENDSVLDESPAFTSSKSGISLDNPVDGGISLEDEDALTGSSDFDLSLEVEDTPKPRASDAASESSEFELSVEKTPRPQRKDESGELDMSLDAEDDSGTTGDDSEFELNLEGSGEGTTGVGDSDSEFELTLDDSGNIAVDENAPQVKSKKKEGSGEQDIFDTDFEVPALDESDDATVADSELESSDFDIALDDSDLAAEEESGSQVVALDEEGEAATVSDDEAAVVDDVEVEEESSDFADLDEDVEVEDVEVEEGAETGPVRTKTVVKEKLIEPAPWGVMPVIFMLPCVIIMFLVGILGYEAVQTSAGLRPPGTLTTIVAGWFGEKVTLNPPR